MSRIIFYLMVVFIAFTSLSCACACANVENCSFETDFSDVNTLNVVSDEFDISEDDLAGEFHFFSTLYDLGDLDYNNFTIVNDFNENDTDNVSGEINVNEGEINNTAASYDPFHANDKEYGILFNQETGIIKFNPDCSYSNDEIVWFIHIFHNGARQSISLNSIIARNHYTLNLISTILAKQADLKSSSPNGNYQCYICGDALDNGNPSATCSMRFNVDIFDNGSKISPISAYDRIYNDDFEIEYLGERWSSAR